jgi:MoaA/NifB/PqqE/SkfB family radical SAM enzyme
MAKLGYLQVTRYCNQQCIICSNPPTEKKLSLKKAKEKIDEIKSEGGEGVIITGGEPTLYEKLPALITYATAQGVFPRIITNGQKMADFKYAKSLKNAGLQKLHLSVYSYRKDVQAAISKKDDSLVNILKTLNNLKKLKSIAVDINIAISKLNADHLAKTVAWLVKEYPFVQHFVFNNLDPFMNRASENAQQVVPRLHDFELELHRALKILTEKQKTFRVERVPLCYLAGFEFACTETRKIIKQESRTVYYLDQKGKSTQNEWKSEKTQACGSCSLNDICAGLYGRGNYYASVELSPVFINKEAIIKKIKNEK